MTRMNRERTIESDFIVGLWQLNIAKVASVLQVQY
jgi:hypothetical protein